MKSFPTPISGVFVVETDQISDNRGSFARLFCADALSSLLVDRKIAQINHSLTTAAGTVRGLHFQLPPRAEMKMVRCVRGRVLDVAVDLRRGSPTFLAHHAEELTPRNGRMLAIPEGCAHGFQALEADSELVYLHTEFYDTASEGGLHPDDPALGIKWPLPVTSLSERDKGRPLVTGDFRGIDV